MPGRVFKIFFVFNGYNFYFSARMRTRKSRKDSGQWRQQMLTWRMPWAAWLPNFHGRSKTPEAQKDIKKNPRLSTTSRKNRSQAQSRMELPITTTV